MRAALSGQNRPERPEGQEDETGAGGEIDEAQVAAVQPPAEEPGEKTQDQPPGSRAEKDTDHERQALLGKKIGEHVKLKIAGVQQEFQIAGITRFVDANKG